MVIEIFRDAPACRLTGQPLSAFASA